ncbi:50S ribosomal protein L9 [Bacteroidota bacterium]
MEVILKQDIEGLGHTNDIVNVKNGYGRNYLIPKGLVTLATPSAKKILNENTKQRAHKEAKLKEEAEGIANKLKELSLTIGAKTSSKGKIFGSVNTIQIAESLSKCGFEIDRKKISINEDQIKEVGKYIASVKLHKEVSVDINFEVVSE